MRKEKRKWDTVKQTEEERGESKTGNERGRKGVGGGNEKNDISCIEKGGGGGGGGGEKRRKDKWSGRLEKLKEKWEEKEEEERERVFIEIFNP
ncbi:hypothetical protein M8J75_006774 [Diaphorina citri]|nr:hypothetical protein M8J75_006774 [Diaphorina citri]KAI5724544.1 hypothetical protein M8J77_004112 [Diaphorina citri]